MRSQTLICFDTEFVSEDCYQPDLCLIQVGLSDGIAIVDPQTVGDCTGFWQQLADGDHVSVAHAAREEYRFCHRYVGKGPANLIDTQIGAALVALEFPAAYSTLVTRFTGKSISKGETRTNWRRRPLSESQLVYAAKDVEYLPAIYKSIMDSLQSRNRTSWLMSEMENSAIRHMDSEDEERWRRVSGIANLKPLELAIIRNLYVWRQNLAANRNQPVRRILRDDLMVEMARLKSDEPQRIRNLRGMNFSRHQDHVAEIGQEISNAISLPTDQLPKPAKGKASHTKLNQVIQFAHTALGIVCRREMVAPALVGTMQDLRDLVGWKLGLTKSQNLPLLATGWRKEIVGDVINDLLEGKVSIKVTDPMDEFPLEFDRTKD